MTRNVWMPLLALLLALMLTACGGDEGGSQEPTPTPLPPQILKLSDKFQNNIKDKASAFVVCEISLEAASEEDLTKLSENVPHIRDIINGILRSKTFEELSQEDAQELLRNEITEQIKTAFELEDLKGVYFEKYYTA